MKPDNQIILSHAGKQHSYHVAKALHQLSYLKKFYTSSYVTNPFLQKWLINNNNQFFTKRFLSGLDKTKVEANWRFEIKEHAGRLLKYNSSKIEEFVYARDVVFDTYMAKKMERLTTPIFWGFQGSCKKTIDAVKDRNGFAICELATAHITYAKKILVEEQQLHPAWADSISNIVFPKTYEERLESEPFAASLVVAASSFTKQTLIDSGIHENKIQLLPLGASVEHIKYIPNKTKNNRPLKLLYAGTVTQRKGIYYLLEAMKNFPKQEVELHIIGNVFGSAGEFKKHAPFYTYHGATSQQNLFKKYCEFDALVLPTIFEGFALVIVEAMAAGLPVITTAHSIGPDLINDNKNGYVIPIRDIKAIQDAIIKLQEKNSIEWEEMQINARNTALNYSWNNYTLRLDTFLSNLKI
jgi:glycosyltransferase involved in cell wall biosynthesis